MPHMIWKGAISFGLVHVPVQLYPATQSEKVGFNLLDKRSMDPIGYKQINKNTGKEVTRDNIVRGFEYEKGKYVVMTDAEIRSANPESTQTVEILAFVEAPGNLVPLARYAVLPRARPQGREGLRAPARRAEGHRARSASRASCCTTSSISPR